MLKIYFLIINGLIVNLLFQEKKIFIFQFNLFSLFLSLFYEDTHWLIILDKIHLDKKYKKLLMCIGSSY
jgi:hypothetical protein